MTIFDQARGKWVQILSENGIPVSKKHGPCPMCGGKDRFRYSDIQGEGDWICNQCGSGNGFQLLQRVHGWDNKTTMRKIEETLRIPMTPREQLRKKDPKPALIALWKRRQPWRDVPQVRDYLLQRTPLQSEALYAIPDLEYWEHGKVRRYPGMIALVTNAEGKGITIHRTYIADVTSRKKCMPPTEHMAGSSIRLMDFDDTLGVAEGIETALCACDMFNTPVWSVVSTFGMETWEPPESAKKIIIFGDNDQNYAGQKSAYILANRLAAHREVQIEIPAYKGQDWADIWEMEYARTQIQV